MKELLIAGQATRVAFHIPEGASTLGKWEPPAARSRRALATNDREDQLTMGVGEP